MLSTTLISVKLLLAFIVGVRSNPGYVEKDERPEFEFKELMKQVPTSKLCPDCKIIRPPRARHCQICNKCTDRYETHCVWLNNCIGRTNANYYMIFIFYVWLDVFLLGWISMSSIQVTGCQEEKYGTPCYYRDLCVGCNNLAIHYIVTVGDMIICFFFMGVTTWPTIRQFINYCKGETSYERFARKGKNPRIYSKEYDSDESDGIDDPAEDGDEDGEQGLIEKEDLPARRKRRGCCLNCREMCCNK